MTLRQPRRMASTADLYVACYCGLRDWGGGLRLAQGAVTASAMRGLRARLIGVRRERASGEVDPTGPAASPDEAPLRTGGRLWMLRSLTVARQLADWLRTQPRPNAGVLAVSPFWVLAARAAWPDLPVAYLFPCLLTNCLPYVHAGEGGFSRRLHRAAIAWLERRALLAATVTIAPTQLARDEIAKFSPSAEQRIRVAPFGCHAPALSTVDRAAARRRLGFGPSDFALLAAGVFDRNKGFELAIEALASCPPHVRLVLAGDGPEQQRLLSDAARRAVGARVVFPGPQSDMAWLIAACDAALSTSHYDTYPNVLLEALAAGRPVIAPRHDPPRVHAGITELIGRGGGVSYERSRAASLAEAIETIAGDPRRYAHLSAEAAAIGDSIDWEPLARLIGEFARPARRAQRKRERPELEAVHGA